MNGLYNKKIIDNDNYNTPIEAWRDVLQFIPSRSEIDPLVDLRSTEKDQLIWDPFYNDGTSMRILNELGYMNVIHNNIDFFEQPELENAIIISNPPYSIKGKIIKHLIDNHPNTKWILLMPISTLVRKYLPNIQLIIPKKRYQFKERNKENPYGCNFDTAWFAYGFNFKNDLVFLE
jgi:hypothetical protein